jgi:hypothetical protein
MEQGGKDLNNSKERTKNISIIRAALKDWERPCENGVCEFKVGSNPCPRWDCDKELERIKEYKKTL